MIGIKYNCLLEKKDITEHKKSITHWLDCLFVQVLINEPEKGSYLFSQMAKCLSGDSYARFMSGEAHLIDWCRVIAAMPKKPFLQTLLQRTIKHSSSLQERC